MNFGLVAALLIGFLFVYWWHLNSIDLYLFDSYQIENENLFGFWCSLAGKLAASVHLSPFKRSLIIWSGLSEDWQIGFEVRECYCCFYSPDYSSIKLQIGFRFLCCLSKHFMKSVICSCTLALIHPSSLLRGGSCALESGIPLIYLLWAIDKNKTQLNIILTLILLLHL